MKRKYMIVYLMILTVMVNGCGDWWNMMLGEDNEIVIKGKQEIKNQRLVLVPGTKVIFKRTKKSSLLAIGGPVYEAGELIIGEGATLIARGTPDNPIVFEVAEGNDNGYLTFKENCSSDSIVQYCKFEKNIILQCKNDVNILNNKFSQSILKIYSGSPLITHNTFYCNFNFYSAEVYTFNINCRPVVRYNELKDTASGGIELGNTFPTVEYNNIFNCKGYAIVGGTSNNKILAKYNYIKDNFGKVGIDTNGSQCLNVVFSNYYRTTPVPNAGCGW